ncbi:unnamed protein product, partial [Effrenium voratum]
ANGLVASLAKSSRWSELLRGLASKGSLEPSVVTFGVAITGCSRASAWCAAVRLAEVLLEVGVEPSVISATSAVSTCEKSSAWQCAVQSLNDLSLRSLEPNIVGFGAVASACEKAGGFWRQAAQQLQSLRRRGIQVSLVLLNAVSSACEKACASGTDGSPWQLGISLLALAPKLKMLPDAVSHNAAISACEKVGAWEQALDLLQDLRRLGLLSTLSFNAAISACARTFRWDLALLLWEDLASCGLQPDLITYSSLISACEKGLVWRRALAIFSELSWGEDPGTGKREAVNRGIKPDLVLCNAVVSACEKGQQWEKALWLVMTLRKLGPSPDAVSYSAAISACSKSAWPWALWLFTHAGDVSLPAASAALGAVARARSWQVALALASLMRQRGALDAGTLALVADASGSSGQLPGIMEEVPLDKLRNVAIIAHVDHGKTTLVDQLMKQSGMGLKVTERMMDSKALEQERGITILSKATRISWNGYVFNIVDTPGHADFGGEVERVLSMVDGVVLLVDIIEGPKAQTKFVLQKALKHEKMKPLVVINKVDRPLTRDPGEVENDIFDVFATMASNDDQLEYPTLYASGKAGFCARSLEEARSDSRPTDMAVLYEAIKDVVPPPSPQEADPAVVAADEKCKGFSMLVSQLDRLPALGPTVTGKVFSGQIHKGDKISCKNLQGEVVASGKVKEITVVLGVTREPVKMAKAGDIVSISVQGFMPKWTQTLVSHAKVPPVPCQPIDPPILAVRASVNDSPLAGKDGKYITLNAMGERLEKEALTNPAIEIAASPNRDYFEIRGRGEMQLGILIEEMRREGYEMSLSPPSVVKSVSEDGTTMEPWEDVQIEVDLNHGSQVIERMSGRNAKIVDMNTVGDRQVIRLEAPTSSMLGLRSWLREISGGTAIVVSEFKEMQPLGPPAPRDRNGVLCANTAGIATAVDLGKAARLGKLFIGDGFEVYPGMIFGESNGQLDIDTNISRKHDGYTSASGYSPPAEKRLEEALSYILEDEKLEVTPKRIVMRKAILDANERRVAAKAAAKR